jgi:hypothetical protein
MPIGSSAAIQRATTVSFIFATTHRRFIINEQKAQQALGGGRELVPCLASLAHRVIVPNRLSSRRTGMASLTGDPSIFGDPAPIKTSFEDINMNAG